MAIHRAPDQDRYDTSYEAADDLAHLYPAPVESEFEDDPWAWAVHEDVAAEAVDVSGCYVTAVLVAMDAARWLPGTLAALGGLTHRPNRLIAIDNDSTDGTRALLDRAVDGGLIAAVYPGRRSYGFGAAVASALEQDRGAASEDEDTLGFDAVSEQDTHWLWLLHDDAAPAPDALYRLLAHVTLDPRIDVTGPKLLLPRSRQSGQRLGEVGVSISGGGRRDLGLDVGEIDQGQRDQPQQRLGVSTCGMLVRTDVWHDLDGLDAGLPVFRDGVDFGWRANLLGYRVVTTPQARFTHREVGRAGLRAKTASGRRPGKMDRQLGMLVVAAHAPGRLLPLVWLRLVVSCLLHAVGYLLGKAPGRALDELSALGWFLVHPGRVLAARRRVATLRPVPGAEDLITRLRPPWWSSLRGAAEAVAGVVSDRYRSVAGESDTATLDELTGDDFSSATEEKPRPPWLNPVVLAGLLAVVGSVVAARGLIGRGSLTGPALLPAPASLGAAWHAAWAAIPGAPSQSAPPWLAFVALGSTVLAGQPEWFVTLLVCGVVPLSFLAAYPVTRRLIETRRIRLWVAGTYALLPVLLGGTNQGRLSLSVLAIGLPALVLAVRALVLRRVRTAEAWRGGWGAGVVLVALVAFEPSLIIFALLAGLAGLPALRRSPRKIGRVAIALAVPLLILAPWLPSLIAAPGRLLVGPDSALDGAPAAPPVWQLLIGRGLGLGLPPLWLSATVVGVVWLAAVIALFRQPRRRAVLAGWVAGLIALAMAVALSRLVVDVPPVGTEVRPWVGGYLLIAFGSFALAAGAGLDDLPAHLSGRSFSWLQPASVLAGVAVGLVTLAGAGWWVWAGAKGPIDRVRLNAIPPYVLNAAADGTRILAIDVSGDRARYSVIADDQIRLGDADRGSTFGGSTAARTEVADLVVRLVAGTADSDLAPQLAELGIGYLWVSGADETEQARIDDTPGLGAASGNERGIVWQLDPAVTRAAVLEGQNRSAVGESPAAVPAGSPGRQLAIGEAADPRWRASLDGSRLTPASNGWQQAFVLPADGGSATWSLNAPWQWWLFGQLAGLLVAGVFAAPAIRRPEVRDPTKTARRAAIGTAE
jgi:GT2 family glycosyltransferase